MLILPKLQKATEESVCLVCNKKIEIGQNVVIYHKSKTILFTGTKHKMCVNRKMKKLGNKDSRKTRKRRNRKNGIAFHR